MDERASITAVDQVQTVSLEAVQRTGFDVAAICRALADPSWLGPETAAPPGDAGVRRFEADLAFTLTADGRTLTFRKAALVDVALLAPDDHGCTAEIAWRAAAFAPLFPVFGGGLLVRPDRLELRGRYVPPSGRLGLLIDGALLNYFARRTAEWFLDRVIEAASGR